MTAQAMTRTPLEHERVSSPPTGVSVRGIGCAVPAQGIAQHDAEAQMAQVWKLRPTARERLGRIALGSGIDFRHSVAPLGDVVGMSTHQRMQVYEHEAPLLAARAAREALRAAGVEPSEVTDVIVVSCTGFSAPGVDAELVVRLGLRDAVARFTLGFHGCYGAVSGLRLAQRCCAANPRAVALVVCVELCSLHFRADRGIENQVVSMLFADGAGAAVVAGRDASPRGNARALNGNGDGNDNGNGDRAGHGDDANRHPLLGTGIVKLAAAHADAMSWRVTDAGFAMTLSPHAPRLLRGLLLPIVEACQAECGVPFASFLIHPGGREIIDAVDDALGLRGAAGIEHARCVMRNFGNMSSATLLFVLRDALKGAGLALPALLIAFGPGLTIEAIPLLARGRA